MSHPFRLARIIAPLVQREYRRALMGNKIPTAVSTGFGAAHYSKGVLKDGEDPSKLTSKEWKDRLSGEQYYVARQKGTEVPWSGKLLANTDKGTYTCVCCGAPLFNSTEKFDSGSGWPSFYDVHKSENGNNYVKEVRDESLGMVRVEVLCNQCDGHLGHVFNDGPKPTGLRYCINSASLSFEKSNEDS